MMRSEVKGVAAALALAVAIGGCGSGSSGTDATATAAALPEGSEPVELDPAEMSTTIDNPYWPMAPGDRWIYRETGEGPVQRVVVTVTGRTKMVANGVEARVVRDVVTAGGEPAEVTDDWYAQDEAGNIWYLGEKTAEYENGEVSSRAGSFEAGTGGAQPGIALPADPHPGLAYRQEYLKGEAEDRAEVLSVDQQVEVPTGRYRDALMTRDFNPLEPAINELKLYARNVGPVLALTISGGSGREELVSFEPGGGAPGG